VQINFSIGAIPATNDPLCRDLTFQVQASDNGHSIGESLTGAPDRFPTGSCSSGAASLAQNTSWTWFPQSLGLHTLNAVIFVTNDTGDHRQYNSNSVTVCVLGDPLSPPQNIPVGLTSPGCHPPVPAPVPTPTATPVTPVPIQRNPNQHGSGCGQYSSQSSCNLAGCSWNPQNSTCGVNP
jgi:hypothetical protein